MPHTYHVEQHFNSGQTLRDIVIGMSDGLTVPFALAAGLTGAVDQTHIVITAGLAEIAAGAIAMGLGGYLAARTDSEHFRSEREREAQEVEDIPEVEAEECAEIFRSYGLPENEVQLVVDAIRRDKKRWIDFMMKFELGIDDPEPKRAVQSALTIGLAYIAGGMIPLSPYFFTHSSKDGLVFSIALTSIALFVFGFIKGRLTVAKPFRSGWHTLLIGGLAASIAYLIAKFIAG